MLERIVLVDKRSSVGFVGTPFRMLGEYVDAVSYDERSDALARVQTYLENLESVSALTQDAPEPVSYTVAKVACDLRAAIEGPK